MDITHAGGVGSPSYAALQRPYLRPPSDVVERAAAAHAEAWPSSAAYLACPARAHALRFAHVDNPPASSASAAASPPYPRAFRAPFLCLLTPATGRGLEGAAARVSFGAKLNNTKFLLLSLSS